VVVAAGADAAAVDALVVPEGIADADPDGVLDGEVEPDVPELEVPHADSSAAAATDASAPYRSRADVVRASLVMAGAS